MSVHVVTENGNLFPIHNASVYKSDTLSNAPDNPVEDYAVRASIYGGTPAGNTTIASGLTPFEQERVMHWITVRLSSPLDPDQEHKVVHIPNLLKDHRRHAGHVAAKAPGLAR